MHVFVTGGCGYIGSALVPQLLGDERIDRVTVFDSLETGSPRTLMGIGLGENADFAFQRGDIREYGTVEDAMRGVDTVIHLAAITGAADTHDHRDRTFAVNYDGTENVLTAAGKLGVDTVVLASSCNVYGRAASESFDEETVPEPLNPYAESKLRSERALADAAEEYGFHDSALRMSTNYGYSPGVRFNLVVNQFVFRALTNRPLTVYGDGNNWRPFIHVTDAARAYKHAACNPTRWSDSVYNVGTNGENYRINEIASIVRDELGPAVEITHVESEQPGPSYHVNFDRLEATGFETEWTVREGVADLANRFRARTPPTALSAGE